MDADGWNARYRGALWNHLPPRAFQDAVAEWSPGRALDIATGDGRNAIWLARKGWSVTAVDFSSEAISRGQAAAASEDVQVRWLVDDALGWEPDEQFDLVSMLYLHLPAEQNRRMLQRAARWVAPGGHLFVLGHDLANLQTGAPGPREADRLYTTQLLTTVDASMRVLRCEQLSRDLATDSESAEVSTGHAIDTLLVATVILE